MNATEEWLRYIEDNAIRQKYGVKDYSEPEDDSEEDKEKTKDIEAV